MGVRLFVGNLPPQLCFPELEDLFIPFGAIVSADLMTDPTTGRSRGFGFVEMESNDAARAAVTALHGSQLDGQTLTVNEANPVDTCEIKVAVALQGVQVGPDIFPTARPSLPSDPPLP